MSTILFRLGNNRGGKIMSIKLAIFEIIALLMCIALIERGSFNDYVDQILTFFDLPMVEKRRHFRYYLPFVHVDNSKITPPAP